MTLVLKLRLAMATTALLALMAIGIAVAALNDVNAARRTLIDDNLAVMMALDGAKSEIPQLVEAILNFSALRRAEAVSPSTDTFDLDEVNSSIRRLSEHANTLARLQDDPDAQVVTSGVALSTQALLVDIGILTSVEEALQRSTTILNTALAPVSGLLSGAHLSLSTLRDTVDGRIKASDRVDMAVLRQYLLIENAIDELYDIERDFDVLTQASSAETVTFNAQLVRVHLRDMTYILARLPASPERQDVVQTLKTFRTSVLDGASSEKISYHVNLLLQGQVLAEHLLVSLDRLQQELSTVAQTQARLVAAQSLELDMKSKALNRVLLVCAGLVGLLTLVTLTSVLGPGLSGRLRTLNRNVLAILAGERDAMILPGFRDELSSINASLDELRLQTVERERMEADLRRAIMDARDAAESKTNFLSTLGHEVRTPLNAIIGLFDLLEGSEIADRQRQRARNGRKAAENLLNLLNKILEATQIEGRNLRVDNMPFRTEELRRDLTSALEGGRTNSGKEITTNLIWPEAIPAQLQGDELRIRQILNNLIENAFRFTPEGDIRVEVLYDAQANDSFVVTVTDSGIGISAEMKEKIFDVFHQLSIGNQRLSGSGLGLTISRSLANLMQGSLSVESTPGEGSAFTLQLPLKGV